MKDKKAILVFLFITFILSSICYYLVITGGESARNIIALLMWCPAIGAFIVQRLYYKGEKVLGFHKCSFKYNMMGFVLPLIYLGVSYGIYWWITKDTLSGKPQLTSIGMFIAMFFSSFITALGEEIGWRGFLLPKLSEATTVTYAIVFSGLIWAVWHFPLMITGVYKPGTPLWYQLSMFTIEILIISAMLTILRLKSNSVWPAAIFHASHNLFDQTVFMPLTVSDSSPYYIGETGILTAITMSIVLLIFYWIYRPINRTVHKKIMR